MEVCRSVTPSLHLRVKGHLGNDSQLLLYYTLLYLFIKSRQQSPAFCKCTNGIHNIPENEFFFCCKLSYMSVHKRPYRVRINFFVGTNKLFPIIFPFKGVPSNDVQPPVMYIINAAIAISLQPPMIQCLK